MGRACGLDKPDRTSHNGAMSADLILLARAADYAARQHVSQRRKGERSEPYVNHLTEVTDLLASATGGRDPVLLAAGMLHDTLEDTDATYEDLEQRFGPEVAALVAEVTDDKSLPKEERKRLQIAKTGSKSVRARMLKLADKTSNLRALVSTPPAGWTEARLADYVVWAAEVVKSCRGLNPTLEAAFDAAHEEAARRYGR